jgi:uncharacterized membrane protein YcaP (DUF421 family)
MHQPEPITTFDWYRILFTNEAPVNYLFEIVFRTLIMFLFLIVVLKFLSKRGVKQLSVFELAILIALGSATGDPMFYHDVSLLYGFTVLIVVIILYRTITYYTSISKKLERLLEGEPVCLLENGKIKYDNYKKVGLPDDKFFAELRLKSADHLGQVKRVYLETSGEMSVYFYEREKRVPGLPIYPELLRNPVNGILDKGKFACITCGNIIEVTTPQKYTCEICGNHKWLPASDVIRNS